MNSANAIRWPIEYWDEKHERLLVFLTNNLTLTAAAIAAVYKDRWQIELLFKALKQSLRIKTVAGTRRMRS